MAVAAARYQGFEDGEVGVGGVGVAALLGSPTKNVEGEVRVGLRPDGGLDVRRAEPGLEVLDPCLELLLQWGSCSGIRSWRRHRLGRCRSDGELAHEV